MSKTPLLPRDYDALLSDIKASVRSAQTHAVLAVNTQLVQLYWDIGDHISRRQQAEGWGTRVIDRLASDLKAAFPDMKGFSSSNLKYMRFFAQTCPERRIGQQPADQLPWFHIVTILTKVDDNAAREWYAAQTVQCGWSRPTLEAHIKNRLHLRQGTAITNFERRLPAREAGIEDFRAPHFSLARVPKPPYL